MGQIDPVLPEIGSIWTALYSNFCIFKRTFFFSDPPKARLSLGSSIDPDAISEGNDVYMDCEIRANPRVYKVEWYHNVSYYSMKRNQFLQMGSTLWQF